MLCCIDEHSLKQKPDFRGAMHTFKAGHTCSRSESGTFKAYQGQEFEFNTQGCLQEMCAALARLCWVMPTTNNMQASKSQSLNFN